MDENVSPCEREHETEGSPNVVCVSFFHSPLLLRSPANPPSPSRIGGGGTGNGRTSPSHSTMLPSAYNLTIAHENSRFIFLRGGSADAPFPSLHNVDAELDDGIRERVVSRSFSRSVFSRFRVSARTIRAASNANSGTRRKCDNVKPIMGSSTSVSVRGRGVGSSSPFSPRECFVGVASPPHVLREGEGKEVTKGDGALSM